MASLSAYAITLGSTDYPVKYAGLLSYVEPYLTNLESFTFSAGNVGLAGNFTLGAASDLTLNKGTANGVLYLNGSKVATSGSALTYNGSALSLYSTVAGLSIQTALSTNQATITLADVDGRAAVFRSPSGGASNVAQIGTTTNHDVAFLYGNSEQMRLTSTGLGIGTSSPGAKLDVANSTFQAVRTFLPSITDTYHQYRGTPDGTGYEHARVYSGRDTTTWAYGSYLAFYTEGKNSGATDTSVERMRLDSSGNLGLGVTPSAWGAGVKAIDIGTGSALLNPNSSAQTWIYNNAYNNSGAKYKTTGLRASWYQMVESQHAWHISTDPTPTAGNPISFTQAMTLSGTSTPALRVGVTADLAGFNFQAANQVGFSVHNSGSSATAAYFSAANNVSLSSAGNFAVINGTDGILFGATATERARITSGGDLLVGTQSTPNGGSNFYVAGGATILNTQTDVTTATNHIVFRNGNGNVGSISTSGSATTYSTSSDYRLKDNQQPLTGSGAFIDALQPKTWDWKTDGTRGVGFIAHEVQAVSPSSVVGEKDAVDAEDKPVMQAMEYGSAEFIANIIAELQSLRARVAALETP